MRTEELKAIETMETYRTGEKAKAYEMFLNDPTACPDINFEQFSTAMEKMIIRHDENERAMQAHTRLMAMID